MKNITLSQNVKASIFVLIVVILVVLVYSKTLSCYR